MGSGFICFKLKAKSYRDHQLSPFCFGILDLARSLSIFKSYLSVEWNPSDHKLGCWTIAHKTKTGGVKNTIPDIVQAHWIQSQVTDYLKPWSRWAFCVWLAARTMHDVVTLMTSSQWLIQVCLDSSSFPQSTQRTATPHWVPPGPVRAGWVGQHYPQSEP